MSGRTVRMDRLILGFGATLYLYEQMVNDPELSHRMIRFWAGDPLSNSELKKYLQGSSSSDLLCP